MHAAGGDRAGGTRGEGAGGPDVTSEGSHTGGGAGGAGGGEGGDRTHTLGLLEGE